MKIFFVYNCGCLSKFIGSLYLVVYFLCMGWGILGIEIKFLILKMIIIFDFSCLLVGFISKYYLIISFFLLIIF